jgi:hypothetical protein
MALARPGGVGATIAAAAASPKRTALSRSCGLREREARSLLTIRTVR